MPKKYFRVPAADSRRRQYSSDRLKQAVDQVIAGIMSSYQAASTFSVPRGTVARHLAYYKRTGRRLKIGEGRPTVLSHNEESMLVTIIQTRASAGFPMDKSDVTSLIAEYIPYVGKDRAFPGGKPGGDWYRAFLKRWHSEITLRKPELLTLSRALACNKSVIDAWFSILGKKLDELGLKDHPAQIFNCDESGLSTNPGMSRVISKRGMKNPVQVIPGSGKEQFTILALASASGVHYPPFVVFAGKNLYDIWMAGGPQGALYGTSENGWMDTNLFSSWFKKGFLTWTKDLPRPLLLIFDGHMSHISVEVICLARQNDVHLLCLPPHCSHLLQPLDVGVFKPLKDEWRKIVKEWYKESRMKAVDKAQFSKLLTKLYRTLKPHLAVAGFSKCGAYPFDPSVIAVDKLAPAETFDKEMLPDQNTDPGEGPSTLSASAVVSSQNTVTPSKSPASAKCQSENSCLSTPRTAMRKAVLSQLKLSNAAVRQKTVKRKISKQFGGECLTEDEGLQRLTMAAKPQKVKGKKSPRLLVKMNKANIIQSKKKNSQKVASEATSDVEPLEEAETDNTDLPRAASATSFMKVGDFVKVLYDSKYYPAEITAVGDKPDLFQCNCMEACKSGWRWPSRRDELWYQAADIVKKLDQPVPVTTRGVYKFDNFGQIHE